MLIRIPPFRQRHLPVDESKNFWDGIKRSDGVHDSEDSSDSHDEDHEEYEENEDDDDEENGDNDDDDDAFEKSLSRGDAAS
jgi:hypothetical protein